MIDAAKKEMTHPGAWGFLRVLLLLVVTLCLPETRVWGFAVTPQPASGVFESASPSSIGEFTTAIGYDASDSLHAARGTQLEFGFVQAVERQTVARDFYRATTGWNDTKIASHLRGIDFSQPVNIVDIPAGASLTQFNLPGRVGNYYAPVGTSANTLGIYTSGLTESSHVFGSPTRALQSTAASVVDDWSMSGAGWRIQTDGGGTQFFVPNR